MNGLGDKRLIGLGRDDALQYVQWIRVAVGKIGAHVPYYAQNNAAALERLQQLSLSNSPLDFVTTDIVNVYSHNPREGIEFVEAIRKLPDDLRISGSLRLKYIPMLVFTGGGFESYNIEAIHQIDPEIPVVAKPYSDELPRKLVAAVTEYRHRVLEDFHRKGYALFWEGGRFRLSTAYEIPRDFESKYYAGSEFGVTDGYSRLVLVTGGPSIAHFALDEFEQILNASGTTERDLQGFFERHPEFLLGDEYDSYWAEPQLLSPATGQRYRPDFLLQPLALRSSPWRWNVIDLKRHDVDLLIGRKFHVDLSRHVYRAAAQLRDYAEFFDDPRNADMLRMHFGGVVPTPRLTMVIGRLPEADRSIFNRVRGRVSGVHIRTYDEILEFRRAKLDRLQHLGAWG